VVTGDAASEVDGTSSVIRASPHNEHDTGSMEMDDPQGAGQIAPVVNTSIFGEAPFSIAECSPEISASSLRKIGENDSVMVVLQDQIIFLLIPPLLTNPAFC
jgi:hypothetical protein